MAEAEQLLGRAAFDEAQALLSPFLPSHSASSAALHDLLAQVSLAEGDRSSAALHLSASTRIEPHSHPGRWMELGQLRQGREAVEAFERGIDLYREMREQKSHSGGEEEGEGRGEVEVARALSSAYVSLAELYVTDCCDEEGAEGRCEEALRTALSEWPDSAEALYALANLRLIQGEEAQARECWRRSIDSCIRHSADADTTRMPALHLLAQPPAASASSPSSPPSYGLRVNLAKLSYELGEWRVACDLLLGCIEEDDRIIEVHHLAALAHLQRRRFTRAAQLAHRALELTNRAKEEGTAAERRALNPTHRALHLILQQCEHQQDTHEEGEEEDEQDEDEAEGEEGGEQEEEEEEEEGKEEVEEDDADGCGAAVDAGQEEMAGGDSGGEECAELHAEGDADVMDEEAVEEDSKGPRRR